MLRGRAKFSLLGLGTCPVWLLRGNASEVLSFGLFFLSVWLPACGYFWGRHERDMCAGGHAWNRSRSRGVGDGASVKFSCATLDILLVLSYARNRKRRERENLLSSLTAPLFSALPVQWLITNEAIKWLLTKCLSARLSNVSKFQCAVASQICTTESLRVAPPSPFLYSFPLAFPFAVPHVCHTCHLCFYNSSLSLECPYDIW